MQRNFGSHFGNTRIYHQNGFEIHETELYVEGITKPLTVFLFSDIHLAYTDRRDCDATRDLVVQRRLYFPCAPDIFEQIIVYTKEQKPDLSIFLGDIIDFPSDKNLEILKGLDEPGFGPYLYHLGNHDDNFPWESATPEQTTAYRERIDVFSRDKCGIYKDVTPEACKQDKAGFHAVDLGELIIAGGDNVSSEGIASIKKGLHILEACGKPVILCAHLPFHSETLDPLVIQVWLSATRLKEIEPMLSENNNLVSVFAGDVHFFDNNMASGVLPQIISTSTENKFKEEPAGAGPSYWSGIGIVRILPC